MTHIDNVIKKEIDSLVGLGEKIVQQASRAGGGLEGNDLVNVSSWVTRLGQLIRKLYGESSQHFDNYNAAISIDHFYNIHSGWYGHISQVQGIALTVKHDIENDLLVSIKGLLQADLFADFLEIGEHLLEEGYKDAAAVTIGAVLEDGLRKLCNKNGIETMKPNGSSMTIDPLNAELAKKNVYSKLVQKQVTSWAHIRNKAAHGEYDEYNKEQVQMMLLFVQGFAGQHLS
jgi:flagellar biosynthesis chaperone FliJ